MIKVKIIKPILAILLLLTPPAVQPNLLVFTHVTVIDATGAPAKFNQTVVINGSRISALGQTEKVRIPKNAHVVEATGKFLIPGLWDMHVHTASETFFPLYLANGITGVRDMAMELDKLKAWRLQIESGMMPGPRLVIAGPLVDGPHSVIPDLSAIVESPAEGRRIVADLKKQGVDFIKVYNFLSREAFYAIASEVKEQGIPFAGHVPLSVSAAEATDAGQKSIEHLTGILLACSSQEARLRSTIVDSIRQSNYSAREVNRLIFSAPPEEITKTYDEEKAGALFARFANNGIWQVPTLFILKLITFGNDEYRNDVRLKYMPSFIRAGWEQAGTNRHSKEEDEARKRLFQKELEIVGAMHRAGAKFLAGTDTPNPYVFPGFSLHDELALLVQAGFTPMEALQTATRNPAEFLGRLDSLGTIEAGKIADLVLLEANPLADIRNTRSIAAVVLRGKLFPMPRLQEMLVEVEAANNNK